jgi:putative transposase
MRIMAQSTSRTTITHPRNQRQVQRLVEPHSWDASKLWNCGLYQLKEWLDNHNLPSEDFDSALKRELKDNKHYNGLHSQSAQQVLEELADAFNNWLKSDDDRDNPPGYRKQWYHDKQGRLVHEEHPRSTVTWKSSAIRHDEQNHRLRLSKGENHKSSKYAHEYIIVNYEKPEYREIGEILQVRAVWNGDEYEIHIVHEVEVPEESPGDKVAGVDLGICVSAAVAFPDEAVLYPGNTLKEDKHYFQREEYETEGPNGPSNRAEWAREKLSRRTTDFRHKLSHEIAEQCVERNVGTIVIGDPSGVEEDDWGRHGNKKLHNWGFSVLADMIEYKCLERGIQVERPDERGTSSTCSNCGHTEKSDRVHRGLWKCSSCGIVVHADINGADNIRQKAITVTPPLARKLAGDSGNGGVALPSVYHFDRTSGFQPRDCVVDCKPETSNPVSSSPTNSSGSDTVGEKGSNDGVAGETGSPSL